MPWVYLPQIKGANLLLTVPSVFSEWAALAISCKTVEKGSQLSQPTLQGTASEGLPSPPSSLKEKPCVPAGEPLTTAPPSWGDSMLPQKTSLETNRGLHPTAWTSGTHSTGKAETPRRRPPFWGKHFSFLRPFIFLWRRLQITILLYTNPWKGHSRGDHKASRGWRQDEGLWTLPPASAVTTTLITCTGHTRLVLWTVSLGNTF